MTGLLLTLGSVGLAAVAFLWFVAAKVIGGLSRERAQRPPRELATATRMQRRQAEAAERTRREAVHLVDVEEAAAHVRRERQGIN